MNDWISPDRSKGLTMTVSFTPGHPPTVGAPRQLFAFNLVELPFVGTRVPCYDVDVDGQRFFAVQQRAAQPVPGVTHVELVQNWFEALKAKMSAQR